MLKLKQGVSKKYSVTSAVKTMGYTGLRNDGVRGRKTETAKGIGYEQGEGSTGGVSEKYGL